MVITEPVSGKSRIEVTIKPDTTFIAAHSDIWGALGLDCFDQGKEAVAAGNNDDEDKESASSKSTGGEGSDDGATGLAKVGLKALKKEAANQAADKGEAEGGNHDSI